MITQPVANEASAGSLSYGPDTMLRVAAALRPGWVVLQDCTFGGDDAVPPAEAEFVLVHPHAGIALLDLSRRRVDADAADRLRDALEATGFTKIHGGIPPIVHLTPTARSLPRLAAQLDSAFDRRPPLMLCGGDAWIYAVRSLLGGRPAQPTHHDGAIAGHKAAPATPQELTDADGLGSARQSAWFRSLPMFCGVLLLTAASGAGFLQYFGPRDTRVGPSVGSSGEIPQDTAPGTLPAGRREELATPPPQLAGTDPSATVYLGHAAPVVTEPPPPLAALLWALSEVEPGQDLASLAVPPAAPPVPAAEATRDELIEANPPEVSPVQVEPVGTMSAVVAGTVPIPSGETQIVRNEDSAQATHSQPDDGVSEPSAPDGPNPPHEDVLALVPPGPLETAVGPSGAQASPASLPLAAVYEGIAATAPIPPAGRPGLSELSPPILELLMRRGEAMVALGNISAARLLYERAATGGEPRAATALGRIYDPAYLAAINARVQPDRDAAAIWYRRAAASGDQEAKEWLAKSGELGTPE